MRRILFAGLWLVLSVFPVAAQNTTGLVVAVCGTVTTAFVPGKPGPFTIDVNGNLCQSSSGGGGGSVTQGTTPWVDNITQWASVTLGAATGWGVAPTGNVPGVNANVLASALPTGAATQTTLAAILAAQGAAPAQQTGATVGIVAGSAIIGKVGIDQTTPGTTNGIVQNAGPSNVTATACSGTVTSGGTANNAFTAQTTLHGFTIANIDTTEVLWISFTTTAAASGTDSYPLPAATATTFAGFGSFTSPPGFGLNHALSVIAATTGHKFSCTWW
jgi:hypothetical protein